MTSARELRPEAAAAAAPGGRLAMMKTGLPMKLSLWPGALAAVLIAAASPVPPQGPPEPPPPAQRDSDIKLPNGRSQKDEILKSEHEQNVKDAGELAELAQQLKEDLEKNDRFIFSIATLKKTDEIEKLARKIRTRLRHN
jgi:hypothetical protein